ncbi:hypothetical protein HOA59_02040 [archaeon]|jgi:hypothetical protein|nr:hypothetical protein [archaeon]MBT6824196.1 hypothetical protein [archaeon]MBT7106960.1 hypothetical protein [archaeon]MBT7297572.1 hypothetical protein [archaeon]
MNKRGQVTIFIILGIVVLAIVGLLFQLRGNIFPDELTGEEAERFVSAQIEPVRFGIESCAEESLLRAARHVMLRGGINSPLDEISLSWNDTNIAFAYDGSIPRTYLPSVERVGNEIRNFMEEDLDLDSCIDEVFNSFEGVGLSINEISEMVLEAPLVTDNGLKQSISYPIELSRGDYVGNIDSLLAVVEIPVGRALRAGNAIVSCYSGDYSGYPDYNLFCNINGIPFSGYGYSYSAGEINYANQLTFSSNGLNACEEFQYVDIPVEGGEDVRFCVLLKLC